MSLARRTRTTVTIACPICGPVLIPSARLVTVHHTADGSTAHAVCPRCRDALRQPLDHDQAHALHEAGAIWATTLIPAADIAAFHRWVKSL